MAFVPAPGVALARISGSHGANPWAIVLHYYAGTSQAWTQAQINALATSLNTHYPTYLEPIFTNVTVAQTIECADLTDSGDRSIILPTLSMGGSMPGSPGDLSACVLINYKINSRYRGGHGRTYLPGAATTQSTNGDTWAAGHVTLVNNSWQSFQAAIKTDLQGAGLAAGTQCVPRFGYTYTDVPAKHKYSKEKATFVGAFPVLSFSISNQLRSQRRRLGK